MSRGLHSVSTRLNIQKQKAFNRGPNGSQRRLRQAAHASARRFLTPGCRWRSARNVWRDSRLHPRIIGVDNVNAYHDVGSKTRSAKSNLPVLTF